MRTPSSQKCRLDLAPPLADRFILGVTPSITARYFSSCPSDPTSRWTPCPPKYCQQWLQLRLGCIQLSPSCPFRRLHTFCRLRPARNYPRFRIWRPSFERQRDFNPPEQHAAQRALFGSPTTDRASLTTSLLLIGSLTPVSLGDPASSPEVTRCSSVPCRPQTPWCGGRQRDFNPPEQRAAQRALLVCRQLGSWYAS